MYSEKDLGLIKAGQDMSKQCALLNVVTNVQISLRDLNLSRLWL
jgi:hypothetical protein